MESVLLDFTVWVNSCVGWVFETWMFWLFYMALIFAEPFASVPLLYKTATVKNLEALSLETVIINLLLGFLMICVGFWWIRPELWIAGLLGSLVQLAILLVGLGRGAQFALSAKDLPN